jgi:hypothetical protein
MAARFVSKLFPTAVAGAAGYGYYSLTYKRSDRQYDFEPGSVPDESLSPQPWINLVFRALLPSAVTERGTGNMMLHCEDGSSIIPWTPPSRDEIKKKLRSVNYDVLVIGGGATGCGVALDATTRGLTTAVVEMDDFAAGTSSRSTKLIHGGIRYLALAFQSQIPPKSLLDLISHLHYDHSMMQVVMSDLSERAFMMQSAPFMSRPLPMMIPLQHWWEVPVYWVSVKMYDFLAGSRSAVPESHLISKAPLLPTPQHASSSRALHPLRWPAARLPCALARVPCALARGGEASPARTCLTRGPLVAGRSDVPVPHAQIRQVSTLSPPFNPSLSPSAPPPPARGPSAPRGRHAAARGAAWSPFPPSY